MSNIQEIAENLHAILYGKKSDDVILNAVMSNNLQNRVAIAQYYKATYETSLFDDIKNKISGDFGYCAAQMFLSGKELKTDITKAFGGAIGKDLLNLFTTKRISNPKPNKKECEKYATKLAETEIKNWTEDENLFKEIFIQRSPEELILIARYYLKNTGNNLIDMVEKKAKGKNQTLLKEILYNNIMPHELFAEKIYLAIKGAGTNEEVLSRALVSRCELDMGAMRDIYQTKYKASMKEDIIGDTSGSYQKICIFLSEK